MITFIDMVLGAFIGYFLAMVLHDFGKGFIKGIIRRIDSKKVADMYRKQFYDDCAESSYMAIRYMENEK